MCKFFGGPKRLLDPSRTGGTGGCGVPHVGAGNQTQVLEEQRVFLATEPSLPPLGSVSEPLIILAPRQRDEQPLVTVAHDPEGLT